MSAQTTVEKTRITPAHAGILLAQNVGNRPINRNSVVELRKTIEGGKWQFNGDPIRVATTGRLLDGQHRLIACLESGLSIETAIVYGLPEDCFAIIDNGRRRSAADTLGIAGFSHDSAKWICASIVNVSSYCEHRVRAETRNLSNQAMLDLARNEMSYVVNAVDMMLARYGKKNNNIMRHSAPMAALAVMLNAGASKSDLFAFFDRVFSGEMIKRGDPEYLLREYLLSVRSSGGHTFKDTKIKMMRSIIYCWNLHMDGQARVVLRAPDSNIMPKPKKGA